MGSGVWPGTGLASGNIHGLADELHSWPGEGEEPKGAENSWARVTQSHHPRDERCVHANFMPSCPWCLLAAGVDQQVWTLPGIDVEK